jgi:multidrug efflux pump subunit AcrA (membrane-fusion protein)
MPDAAPDPSLSASDPPVSPEGLDHAFSLVPRRSWLALAGAVALLTASLLWGWFGSVAVETSGEGVLLSGSVRRILSPIDGTVESRAGGGSTLKAGEALVILRAADASVQRILAEETGTVVESYVEPGMTVARGTAVANLEPGEHALRASVFVPLAASVGLTAGMQSHIAIVGVPAEQGMVIGRVVEVSRFPVSPRRLMALFENAGLVESIARRGPLLEVTVEPERDGSAGSEGYRWTTGRKPRGDLAAGMSVRAEILLRQERPLALLFPGLRR